MSLNEKKKPLNPSTLCGVFTKKEAASLIMGGCSHLHSTSLGAKDPGFVATQAALHTGKLPTYAWERTPGLIELKVGSSVDRLPLIEQVVLRAGIEGRRSVREKVENVLEELLTNAIYHAYRVASGKEKYSRRAQVTLNSNEVVTLGFHRGENGLFLKVVDQAGSLPFSEVAQSLHRCYETDGEIQQKESGAGLGTYMVFDAVTHLKFERVPGRSTSISCWIADHKSYEAETFSFNFFEVGFNK